MESKLKTIFKIIEKLEIINCAPSDVKLLKIELKLEFNHEDIKLAKSLFKAKVTSYELKKGL